MKLLHQHKLLVVAMMTAMPWLSAHAQSAGDLQKEIALLKSQLQLLQQKVDAIQVRTDAVEPDDWARIKTKVEAQDDAVVASGFANLKINGMINPTFIYSQRQDQAGFNFLSNFDGRGNSGNNDAYAFDNSYFGQVMLDIQKETDNGTKWRLTLSPHKSASAGYNLGSIVHEASVSVPMGSDSVRLIAGQVPDWSGYEYSWAHMHPLISHNLLFDFTLPSYYNGAGMEYKDGKWITKWMVGNINSSLKPAATAVTDPTTGVTTYTPGDKKPGFTYRADYAKGEFSGFGFAGTHSFASGSRADSFEVDGYFIRGDLTLQGQVGLGRQQAGASNGRDAAWVGLSGLVGYKITPRTQIVLRADYLRNGKNGGGVYGGVTDDYRNGFGPAMQDDGTNTNTWVAVDPNKGVNRYALTTGVNYLVNASTTWKAEIRYDGASGAAFQDVKTGTYRSSNWMLGTGLVVQF
jgi:Protein of unknown function (DUF3138)